jgi:hypothetical protein
MKYYYREHVKGYQRVKTEGKTSWGEIHDNTDSFEKSHNLDKAFYFHLLSN